MCLGANKQDVVEYLLEVLLKDLKAFEVVGLVFEILVWVRLLVFLTFLWATLVGARATLLVTARLRTARGAVLKATFLAYSLFGFLRFVRNKFLAQTYNSARLKEGLSSSSSQGGVLSAWDYEVRGEHQLVAGQQHQELILSLLDAEFFQVLLFKTFNDLFLPLLPFLSIKHTFWNYHI